MKYIPPGRNGLYNKHSGRPDIRKEKIGSYLKDIKATKTYLEDIQQTQDLHYQDHTNILETQGCNLRRKW